MRIETTYVSPPIPTRGNDWCAQFDWYDGDDDQPTGWGATEESAVLDLLMEAVGYNGDGSEQDEITNLAFAGWKAAQPTPTDLTL